MVRDSVKWGGGIIKHYQYFVALGHQQDCVDRGLRHIIIVIMVNNELNMVRLEDPWVCHQKTKNPHLFNLPKRCSKPFKTIALVERY